MKEKKHRTKALLVRLKQTDLDRVIAGIGDVDVGGATLVVEKHSHVRAQGAAARRVHLHVKHNTDTAQGGGHWKRQTPGCRPGML